MNYTYCATEQIFTYLTKYFLYVFLSWLIFRKSSHHFHRNIRITFMNFLCIQCVWYLFPATQFRSLSTSQILRISMKITWPKNERKTVEFIHNFMPTIIPYVMYRGKYLKICNHILCFMPVEMYRLCWLERAKMIIQLRMQPRVSCLRKWIDAKSHNHWHPFIYLLNS